MSANHLTDKQWLDEMTIELRLRNVRGEASQQLVTVTLDVEPELSCISAQRPSIREVDSNSPARTHHRFALHAYPRTAVARSRADIGTLLQQLWNAA